MSKVLLVEDNTSAVKKIVRYIDNISADLEVHSVSEAGEALQYAKANDVSLFILSVVAICGLSFVLSNLFFRKKYI